MRKVANVRNIDDYVREIKIEGNGLTIFFLGVWIIIWICIFILIFVGLVSMPSRIYNMGLFILIFLVIGLLAIDQFLWQVRGKEIIKITTDELRIYKIGKLFTIKKIIKLSDVNSISYSFDNQTMYFENKYFYKGGVIKIDTIRSSFRVGQNISKELAIKIVKEINEVMLQIC